MEHFNCGAWSDLCIRKYKNGHICNQAKVIFKQPQGKSTQKALNPIKITSRKWTYIHDWAVVKSSATQNKHPQVIIDTGG